MLAILMLTIKINFLIFLSPACTGLDIEKGSGCRRNLVGFGGKGHITKREYGEK